ncbi:glycoside hydrolase family 16 protein [Teratosphaeria destructans]|uniref:Glycoside hydrolase family 16 protein n=1 Tax=Teratosphaeria destructans TaxID=418781 RepID=A0A9W7SWN2_9PEZI|nr:glycoside hydrolase family 16 protein [Teratosphaeria destructans]
MHQLRRLLCVALAALTSAQYSLDSSFYGVDFFDNFDFYTDPDPTLGFVQYVNRTFANQTGMLATSDTQAAWGVDNTELFNASAAFGRYSVRLTSNRAWTHGLFVLNLAHMPPNQCGVWPAFWTLGTAPESDSTWPNSGEIDIIEYANTGALNQMSLHTSASDECTVAGSGQTGTLLTNNCSISAPNGGCSVSAVDAAIEGNDFNTNKGGFYAMEWTSSGIKIWYWPTEAVPSDLESRDAAVPDPTIWGPPVANFQGDCDFDARFFNHSIVFDTTFCGSYAGNTFAQDSCPLLDPSNGWTSCNEFVANNPQAYVDAYWQVNWLNVYTSPAVAVPTMTTSKSSIVPAVSTSPVLTMPVPDMGQSSTPLLSLLVTSSPVATNSPPPASTTSTFTTGTPATRARANSNVAQSLTNEPGSNHDFLETRTTGEFPAECRSIPPGPVPAPDPLPYCNDASTSSNANAAREAEAQSGGIAGGSTSFCSVPGMDCDQATSNASKRDAEPQAGGSVGFCSVPGMDCSKHLEADGITKREAGSQDSATAGSVSFCGVSGVACQYDIVGGNNEMKRTERIEHQATTSILPISPRTAGKENSEEVLMVPETILPPGTKSYVVEVVPRTARTEMTEVLADLASSTLPNAVGMLPRASNSLIKVVTVKRQEMETGLNAKASDLLSTTRITATCIPAMVHAPEGGLTASGCLLPSGAIPSTTLPLEAADTTTTIAGTVAQEAPRLLNGVLALSDFSRKPHTSAGYSVEAKTYALVAVIVALVSLLTSWSNDAL